MRRAQLRPHPAATPTIELVAYRDAKPVFIVGCVRSGTSAMMAALRDGAGIRGFNEGQLGQLLPTLLSAVDQHYQRLPQKPTTMIGCVSQDFMANGIKNLFGKAFIEVMGEGRWLDKTPGGANIVAACPTLLEIFPNASFIFCKRRGVENVLSRQRKFPGKTFESYCEGWARTMEAWLAVRDTLGARAIEVDQRDMAVEPIQISRRVADFLELSSDQQNGLFRALRGNRVEQTRAVQDETQVRVEDTGWSAAEQEAFRRICGPMMATFGYGAGDRPVVEVSSYRFFAPVSDGDAERENIKMRRACRSLDASSFAIDPNPYNEASAGIRHKGIEMDRFRQFSARLRIQGRGARFGQGVVFSFSLERIDDRAAAFAAEQVVHQGQPLLWACDLPPLSGRFDAVLSVRPASQMEEEHGRISGIWIDAQLS